MHEIARIRTNGFTTGYLDVGPRDASAIVMSHSHFCDHSMWLAQIEALSDRYRIVAYDTRGHGASEVPKGPYNLEELADDAIGLIDGLNLGPVHFVGLSLGGMLGMMLALRAPDRLASLVLCDTAAEMPAGIWDERMAIARSQGLGPLVEPTMMRWFTSDFISREPDAVDAMRRVASRTRLEGYLGCAEAIRGMRLLSRIQAITVPCRVIVGANDPATPVSASEAIVERISGSDLVVLENAAHLANLERPEAFTSALAEFIDAQDGAPSGVTQGGSAGGGN